MIFPPNTSGEDFWNFFPLRELVSAAGALRAVMFHLYRWEKERERDATSCSNKIMQGVLIPLEGPSQKKRIFWEKRSSQNCCVLKYVCVCVVIKRNCAYKTTLLNEQFTPKLKMLSSFTYPHIIPAPYYCYYYHYYFSKRKSKAEFWSWMVIYTC